MATQIGISNIRNDFLAELAGPEVSAVQVTSNTYAVVGGNITANSIGYVKITGANFIAGAQVLVDRTAASSVSFVSSTELNVSISPRSAGTYHVFVINPNGAFSTRVNGVSYS